MASWVLLGCGYTGGFVADRLVAGGHAVVGIRRQPGPRSPAYMQAGDLCVPDALVLPESASLVMMAAPARDGSSVLEDGVLALVRKYKAARLIYISSTGVYPGRSDGDWVDEDVAPAPLADRGQHRLAAELRLRAGCLEASVPLVILRAAGIYGPNRGVIARMLRGDYRIIGDGDSYVSRIHVWDLASAVMAAGACSEAVQIYNCADDEPTTSHVYAHAICERLGLAMPGYKSLCDVPASVRAMFTANRRVSNGKMKAQLGVTLRYPTWREFLAEQARGQGC